MIVEIKTINDAETFAKHLVEVEKLSFHPDDDFKDYITLDQKPFYSETDAELRNKLMDDCFRICKKNNVDIYEIMFPILQKTLGIV